MAGPIVLLELPVVEVGEIHLKRPRGGDMKDLGRHGGETGEEMLCGRDHRDLLPRQVDAELLGGLEHILAGGYGQVKEIRARYYLRGDAILVGNIQADGRPLAGSIPLSSRCRRG